MAQAVPFFVICGKIVLTRENPCSFALSPKERALARFFVFQYHCNWHSCNFFQTLVFLFSRFSWKGGFFIFWANSPSIQKSTTVNQRRSWKWSALRWVQLMDNGCSRKGVSSLLGRRLFVVFGRKKSPSGCVEDDSLVSRALREKADPYKKSLSVTSENDFLC